GGAAQRLSLNDIDVAPEEAAGDILVLHEALDRLESLDQRKAKVVEMRFFGGMNEDEIAEVLGISEKTVRRDWQFAKLWLYRELCQ
ncbi:MAG TPA: sigma-70 family RNA polymerase sigma factor, partial [Pyrinomonadaceae bacterium]|nr:sigma-70 family RNA polymerase sigma factor [Pyrinomonadaceae bacterium]